MTASQLYEQLAERGLIFAAQTLPSLKRRSQSPWYVQTLVGFCAWIAGLLLLVFLAIVLPSNVLNDGAVLLAIGTVFCTAAGFLFASLASKNEFANQLAFALSFGGQIGIGTGLNEMGGVRAALWGLLLVEIVMVFVMRNQFQRFLSTLTAVVVWALAMDELFLKPGWGTFGSAGTPQSPNVPLSLAVWVVVWGPVAIGTLWLVRTESKWMAEGREKTLRPVAQGLIASLAVAPLALLPSLFWVAMGLGRETSGSSSLIAPWPLLGALLALLAVALAFTLRQRALMGLGVVFALLEISSFYYVLGASLLTKSLIMILLGMALLASARGLQTVWK